MEVLSIKENDDGSAIVEFDMSEEEKRMLIEYAVVDILYKEFKKVSAEAQKLDPDPQLTFEGM